MDENIEIHADKASSEMVAAFKFDIDFAWCKPSEDKERKKLKIKNPRGEEEIEMIDTSFYYTMGLNQDHGNSRAPFKRQCLRRFTKAEVENFSFMIKS